MKPDFIKSWLCFMGIVLGAHFAIEFQSHAASGVDNLFVANNVPNSTGQIYRFTPGGARSTFASGLNSPSGLAFDSHGTLFASEFGTGNIYRYDTNGTRTTFATGAGSPRYMVFDSFGNLYADSGDYTGNLYRFAPNGVRTVFAAGVLGGSPVGIAIDANNNIYVADEVSTVYKIAPNGATTVFASGLQYPLSVAVDRVGNLYVGEYVSSTIREFSADGSHSTVFATDVHDPLFLAFDSAGNLFESDGFLHSIMEYPNVNGVLSGTATTFANGLDFPYQIAFQPVPEPSSLTLIVAALAATCWGRKPLRLTAAKLRLLSVRDATGTILTVAKVRDP
jgi:sugar lactone lactonase YvrE